VSISNSSCAAMPGRLARAGNKLEWTTVIRLESVDAASGVCMYGRACATCAGVLCSHHARCNRRRTPMRNELL
jgi:hypothetical protein